MIDAHLLRIVCTDVLFLGADSRFESIGDTAHGPLPGNVAIFRN